MASTSDFSVPSNWYQTFFTDPVMRFWEAAVPPAATEADLAFVIRHLGARPAATVLDVPCGSGRHALALSRAGFAVTGFDLSEAALIRARAVAQAEGLSARFVQRDMLDLDVESPADALICMGNSLGYFEPALTRQLMQRFATALRSGGQLIVDTSNCAESILPFVSNRSFSFPRGMYEQEVRYDAMESSVETRAQLTIDGEGHELLYRHFVMTSGEFVRMVRFAGFEITALHADTQGTVFAPGAPRLLMVATKR